MKKEYLGYMDQGTLGYAVELYRTKDEKDKVLTLNISELYDVSSTKGGVDASLDNFEGVDFRTPIVIYQQATRKKETEMIGHKIYTTEPFELLVKKIVLAGDTISLLGDSEAWVIDFRVHDFKKGHLTICDDWKVFDELDYAEIERDVAQLNSKLNGITKEFLEEIQLVKDSKFEHKGSLVFKNYE